LSPLISSVIDVVDRATLGVAEEDVVVGLPLEDVPEEVQLQEVQGKISVEVRGKKWQGGCEKDTPSIPMER
jgi:hypothetical protein